MSVFTYNDGVPASNNDPSSDQPDMLVNTQSINGIWNIDHYTFGSGADIDGRHKQASMANQSAPGIPTGFHGVYYVNNSVPMFQNATSANNFIATYTGTPLANANGYTFLPGGIIFQWGKISSATKNSVTTNSFNTNFPTACYSITGSLGKGTSGAVLTLIPNPGAPPITNFSYYLNTNSSQTLDIYWFAVGV